MADRKTSWEALGNNLYNAAVASRTGPIKQVEGNNVRIPPGSNEVMVFSPDAQTQALRAQQAAQAEAALQARRAAMQQAMAAKVQANRPVSPAAAPSGPNPYDVEAALKPYWQK